MKSVFPEETQCVWCLEEKTELTQDHVIPRSIGGTLEYSLPSCTKCQCILSKAERTLARKSFLAIHAVASQVAPGHPKRPGSGALEAPILVTHPLGGYGETALHCTERAEPLSHCEIKVVPGEAIEVRVRGDSRENVELLFAKFNEALSKTPGPNGLICEVKVSLDVPSDIKDDPQFWPRMVLLPNRNLLLRARDPDESIRFIAAFKEFVSARAQGARTPGWTPAVIQGGTQHHFVLRYNPRDVRRVAAKIAYGVFRLATGLELDRDADRKLRAYILGEDDGEPEPVAEAPETLPRVTGETPYHSAILGRQDDPEGIVVMLYGYGFRVNLGIGAARVTQPIVVFCSTDGTGMRRADARETEQTLAASAALSFPPLLHHD